MGNSKSIRVAIWRLALNSLNSFNPHFPLFPGKALSSGAVRQREGGATDNKNTFTQYVERIRGIEPRTTWSLMAYALSTWKKAIKNHAWMCFLRVSINIPRVLDVEKRWK